MHTIEAAVLVPLGIGVILFTLVLTFALYDGTVIRSESAGILLRWEQGDTGMDSAEEVSSGFLKIQDRLKMTKLEITRVTVTDLYCSVTMRMQSPGIGTITAALLGLESEDGGSTVTFSLAKTDPCLTKRVEEALK